MIESMVFQVVQTRPRFLAEGQNMFSSPLFRPFYEISLLYLVQLRDTSGNVSGSNESFLFHILSPPISRHYLITVPLAIGNVTALI
jgi:hypothetical protein